MCFTRTFMELKLILLHIGRLASSSFTRTFMELKQASGNHATHGTACFTRTFMELKRWYTTTSYLTGHSFTRTFMELKLEYCCLRSYQGSVLLVPLWNWNKMDRKNEDQLREVLLVPLWNWNLHLLNHGLKNGLFYSYLYGIETRFGASIVPEMSVLLVPLWNWNVRFPTSSQCLCCFTRTFMELKLH